MDPQSLLHNLNVLRESTVSTYYSAAVAELKDKIKSEPLKKSHEIYSGCISKDITEEIAKRFRSGGVNSTVNSLKVSFLSSKTTWYILAEPPLPDHLSPKNIDSTIISV